MSKLDELTTGRKLETKEFLSKIEKSWARTSDGWLLVPTKGLSKPEADEIVTSLQKAIEVGALLQSGSKTTMEVVISPTSTEGKQIPAHVKTSPFGEIILEWEPFTGRKINEIGKGDCFVIMQIGNEEMDRLWNEVYDPVLRRVGLSPRRADKDDDGTPLYSQIIESLNYADWVIADLTNERPNCYFEVGHVMGSGKANKLIICCRDDHNSHNPKFRAGASKIHFDLQGFNVEWWDSNDLSTFSSNLERRIRARTSVLKNQKHIARSVGQSMDDVLKNGKSEAIQWLPKKT